MTRTSSYISRTVRPMLVRQHGDDDDDDDGGDDADEDGGDGDGTADDASQ